MSDAESTDHDTKRRGIQSVEIGLRVLMAVAAQRGAATLTVIAEAAGLSASQAHRYLASLMAAGMVRQEGRSGLYDLDSGAIRLGLAGLARLDVFRAVDEAVPAFVRQTGRTCLVAVLGDAGPTLVRWFAGAPPVITSLAVGSVLPLLHSATGRVFLTFGDRPAMEARLAGLDGPARGDPGMVRQEGRSGLYDLDSGAIRLGLAGLARLDVFRAVDEAVPAFVRQTGRTCLVAVLGDAGPTLVRWFAGAPPVITSLAVGSVLPLLHSATGRVFLTFGDRPAMEARLAGLDGPARGAPAMVEALRAQVAQDGCALVDGNLIPGLRALAAPVFDLQGRLALVVNSIASEAIPRGGDADAKQALMATCRGLTETLGGVWPLA